MLQLKYNLFILSFVLIITVNGTIRSDQSFWNELAEFDLEAALATQWNTGVAKNVIVFVGDGMGPNTVTATRLHKSGETSYLSFEKFPHVGLLKTYSAQDMTPDSSSTATALFSGVKTNTAVLGLDANVWRGDCDKSLNTTYRLKSLLQLAQEAGKSTGFVTTMRVTHATPAPLYAYSADRNWECEASIPAEAKACKDIARQLIEDAPGKDINVIFGGGRQVLVSNVQGSEADPIDTWSCYSQDGRNLIKTYEDDKQNRGLRYKVLQSSEELWNLNTNDTDYVLGIFANGHLILEHERTEGPSGLPFIADMTEAAIKILSKNENGFFLMVEGGNIDMQHHRGKARCAISETAALDVAVQRASHLLPSSHSLLLLTSDHTHTLSINGYQPRGSDVFGIAQPSVHDGVNYTTLSYATGGPGSFQYYLADDQVARREPSLDDTHDYHYEQIAAIRTDENTHGGGDVTVYATGPYSHLFHQVHEQHYVFHAVSYAARLGKYADRPDTGAASASAASVAFILVLSFSLLIK